MKKILAIIAAMALIMTGCNAVRTGGDKDGSAPDESYAADSREGGTGSEEDKAGDGNNKNETSSKGNETSNGEMSLEDKLWQLFYVAPEAVSGEGAVTEMTDTFAAGAKKHKVGGIVVFAQNAVDRMQLMRLLGDLSVGFETPVFIGVDEEGGIVSRLSKTCGVTDNGKMSEVETASEARKIGERLGAELSGLGFNMDFAPVADMLVNPDNTEIGSRSFGSDAVDVAEKVAAEVEGMQSRGVSSVLKHFPGHGSTYANSHEGTSESQRLIEQLRSEEFLPFKSGIASGADFVMVSHMSLPNVVGDNTPCSLSPAVISGLLRGELGYQGIVITDALNMGAVTDVYGAGEACVMAVEAGADMLLMPANLDEAHAALLEAVNSGRITEARIDESIERIMSVKRKMGLIK